MNAPIIEGGGKPENSKNSTSSISTKNKNDDERFVNSTFPKQEGSDKNLMENINNRSSSALLNIPTLENSGSSVEKSDSGKKKKTRIKSIDMLRGFSVLWMITAHSSLFWLQNNFQWIYGVLFLIFDVIGANAFIMISGLGASLSYRQKESRLFSGNNIKLRYSDDMKISSITLTKEGKRKRNAEIISYYAKSLILLGIAFLTNVVGTGLNSFVTFNYWTWMVLQTIAMARIVLYPLLQTRPSVKLITGIAILATADVINPIFITLFGDFAFIFYQGPHLNPPFPFFGFFIMGMGLGELIYYKYFHKTSVNLSEFSKSLRSKKLRLQSYSKIFNSHRLYLVGLGLVSIGFFLGLKYLNTPDARANLWAINTFEYWHDVQSLPSFLVRNTSSWSIYSMGIQMTLLGYLFQREEKKKLENFIKENESIGQKPSGKDKVRKNFLIKNSGALKIDGIKANKSNSVIVIGTKLSAFNDKIKAKLNAFNDKIKAKLNAFNDKIKVKLSAFNNKIRARRNKNKQKGSSFFIVMGKNSLTIYLVHHIFLILFLHMLVIWQYIIFYIALVAILYYGFRWYNARFKGKYTLEWLLGFVSKEISAYYLNKSKGKQ